eukprot:CAMPEP_0206452252 /NCGR_PEP_ID=MMETSP0324_2-20121206/19840_1 /ASSEMBLY_ACC=CAM_ASM_000836 /TAXON_ID=2866 /ORGANISM="Crypthecodinium cohnii, Strain Seligo" /LENGTH=58 /DNA_ID=CAMNT_0053922317 /DNA_START=587 /DNA_END=763 /DNA_ORIENTATION=-
MDILRNLTNINAEARASRLEGSKEMTMLASSDGNERRCDATLTSDEAVCRPLERDRMV